MGSEHSRNTQSWQSCAGSGGLRIWLVLGGGLPGADDHHLVGAHHPDHNQIPAGSFTTFLTRWTPPQ